MKTRFHPWLAAVALCTAALMPAWAAYPEKPVVLVVPYPPGGMGTTFGNMVSEAISPSLGQRVVVEYKPGANGALGAGFVAKAPADGYTLLIAPDAATVVNPFVYQKLPYDPVKEFRSVGLVGKATLVLVVSNSLNAGTVEEFVNAAKAKPGVINFGSGGAGHPTHLAMEMFTNRTQIKLTHVPYQGTSPAIQALVTGEIGAMIVGVAEAMPLITAGRIKVVAASGPQAKEKFPQLPELKSIHKDLDMSVWFGIHAPIATPQPVIDKLNTQLNQMLRLPEVRARLDEFGMLPLPGPAAELDAIQDTDRARFGPLVKALGLKAD